MSTRNRNVASGPRRPGRGPVESVLAAERPLTARSVVASTLLGVDPPRLPARLLVRSGELFGIADGTTRVALSRMVAAGEVESHDGHYRLAGDLVGRQARQHVSRSGATRRWNGSWAMAVVVADQRTPAERAALRTAARSLRLGERREGVWLRPDNLTAAHRQAVAHSDHVVSTQCDRFDVRPDGAPAALAARLWDLKGWAERARELHAALGALLPDLTDRSGALGVDAVARSADGDSAGPGILGPAFVVSAATLRHFQADPLLPPDLLPVDWPGADLRALYEEFDAAFRAAWRTWFARHR